MPPMLAASHLDFAYDKRPALDDISLSLAAGEVVALLGPNGSGKSTLIKALLGQLDADGQIVWEGKSISQWTRRDLARRVAYLPQFPGYEAAQRVVDVLRLGRAPYWGAFGLESTRDAEVVERVAAMLDLTGLLARPLDEMSGGQRQRVFIGRALVQEPRAMLLDEPSTSLDLKHQVELLQLLRKLATEQSIAVLMASHELNLSASFADRLLLLDGGKLVAAGKPADILNADVLSRVYAIPMLRIDRPDGHPPVVVPDVRREA